MISAGDEIVCGPMDPRADSIYATPNLESYFEGMSNDAMQALILLGRIAGDEDAKKVQVDNCVMADRGNATSGGGERGSVHAICERSTFWHGNDGKAVPLKGSGRSVYIDDADTCSGKEELIKLAMTVDTKRFSLGDSKWLSGILGALRKSAGAKPSDSITAYWKGVFEYIKADRGAPGECVRKTSIIWDALSSGDASNVEAALAVFETSGLGSAQLLEMRKATVWTFLRDAGKESDLGKKGALLAKARAIFDKIKTESCDTNIVWLLGQLEAAEKALVDAKKPYVPKRATCDPTEVKKTAPNGDESCLVCVGGAVPDTAGTSCECPGDLIWGARNMCECPTGQKPKRKDPTDCYTPKTEDKIDDKGSGGGSIWTRDPGDGR